MICIKYFAKKRYKVVKEIETVIIKIFIDFYNIIQGQIPRHTVKSVWLGVCPRDTFYKLLLNYKKIVYKFK